MACSVQEVFIEVLLEEGIEMIDDITFDVGYAAAKAEMMEEISRLTQLCEAKDAEIADLNACMDEQTTCINEQHTQLSEAQAQIAMQAEFIGSLDAMRLYADQVFRAQEILSATSETVAAWRAKETEPLRSEVAMLRQLRDDIGSGVVRAPDIYEALGAIINHTQATALAYEREVENRGAVKALDVALEYIYDAEVEDAYKKIYEYKLELRTANKGEVK